MTNAIEAAAKFQGLYKVKVLKDCHSFLLSEPGVIGDGKNSGFQAINLALQFGSRKIVLIGFDMRVDLGTHWHGRHKENLNNPREVNVIRWRMRLQEQARLVEKIGAVILNASPVSHLGVYPKVDLLEALRC